MSLNLTEIDAHEQPSDYIKAEYKAFQRLDQAAVLSHINIDDPRLLPEQNGFYVASSISQRQISEALSYLGDEYTNLAQRDVPIVYHPLLPGLLIVPDVVPPAAQQTLMDRMVHRDLSNPNHQTNLHLHYDLPYPDGDNELDRSLFSLPSNHPDTFKPKDPQVHKPMSTRRVMDRRLRWVTLGGQYDWTNRVYPGEQPPEFPSDIARFLQALFPATLAQAAIVNFYSPGDTMMMHRDVSEETDKGLISLSFGCEGLFMIAPSGTSKPTGYEGDRKYLLLRLRSGDAVYMTEESRYAWHGVPKVLKGTCPSYLEDWPAKEGRFEEWRGWMTNKRINLNVRQMRD